MQTGCAAIQRDFNKLKKWARGGVLEFRKGKCQILGTENNSSTSNTDWGMMGKNLGGKIQGGPGDPIKLVDSDSLIARRPLLNQNLNRNLNRNSLPFYVL